MTRLTDRSPAEVVSHHLDAVTGGDSVAMAADYAYDALLQKGTSGTRAGWRLLTTLTPCLLGWRSVSLPLGPLKLSVLIGFGLDGTFQGMGMAPDRRRYLYGLRWAASPINSPNCGSDF